MNLKNLLFALAIILTYAIGANAQVDTKETALRNVLGRMPDRSPLKIDTLEKVPMDGGVRYKIKYNIEPAVDALHIPEDYGYAYLFVPTTSKKGATPAILAIHQDDVNFHIGKSEPAGLAGDSTMYYGKDLFDLGFIVLCPDRYYHADRRWKAKGAGYGYEDPNYERDFFLWEAQAGAYQMLGRNHYGKETYDLSRAIDVLCELPEVDTERIGAIGHSAGGATLPFLLAYDHRIKAAVSSCGATAVETSYTYDYPMPMPSCGSIPGLLVSGISTADFFNAIGSTSILLTRGNNEWGDPAGNQRFIDEISDFEKAYRSNPTAGDFEVIVFDENEGQHSFPSGVKERVYKWLTDHLK